MKTLTIALLCLFSQSSFAADSALPTSPDVSAMPSKASRHELDGSAQTLISSQPCKADREKFCKDVKAGEGAIIKCLKAHKDELSQSCKAAGDVVKEEITTRAHEIHDACGDDSAKFCSDAKGPRKKLACLKAHSSELSVACKSSLPSRK